MEYAQYFCWWGVGGLILGYLLASWVCGRKVKRLREMNDDLFSLAKKMHEQRVLLAEGLELSKLLNDAMLEAVQGSEGKGK